MDYGKDYTGGYVFNIAYNHVHGFGGGIVSDFGAIYIGSGWGCDTATEAEHYQHCYSHAHIYNNWIEDGTAYNVGAGSLYSDTSTSGVTFENNILRGPGTDALKHHCGTDNLSKNNIVHRTDTSSFHAIWMGCGWNHMERRQSYSNTRNIYLLDSLEGMAMGRPWDRYYAEAPAFSSNLYWSKEAAAEATAIFPGELDWQGWRQTGNDTNSLWTDPIFRYHILTNYR